MANCTTPANYFHILRRQLHRDFRKPLILMTPKSLLRHKLAAVGRGRFHRPDRPSTGCCGTMRRRATRTPSWCADDKIKRVVMCSGKVYYDLLEARVTRGIDDVYLLRIEQFYPFPALIAWSRSSTLQASRNGLVPGRAQEPGRLDLYRTQHRMGADPDQSQTHASRYAGRAASASPATGLASANTKHNKRRLSTMR